MSLVAYLFVTPDTFSPRAWFVLAFVIPMLLLFLGVWAVRSALRGGHAVPRSSVLTAIAIVVLVAVLSMLGSRYHVLSIKAILSSSWFLVFGFLYGAPYAVNGTS